MNDNSMKKVLVFGLHNQLGGLENYMKNLIDYKNNQNVHFDFAVSFPTMVYEDEYAEEGIRTYHLPNFKINPIGYYRAIKRILKENKYDAVYYNMMSAANILPLVAASRSGIKMIVAHAHNNGVPKGLVRRILNSFNKRITRKYATKLWANSLDSAQWMFGQVNNVTIIQNAVDTYRLSFNFDKRQVIRKELGVKDSFVVGNIGRFEEQKNHYFLIDIFSEIVKMNKNSLLMLVGKGVLEEQIREKVHRLGLDEKVMFLGERRDIDLLLQGMDVFILPSLFDGLPLALLEAQSAGLPCFASTAIPSEAGFIPAFYQLNLANNPKEWATTILSNKNCNRAEMSNMMNQSVAEIRNQAPKICQLFLD